MRRSILSGMTAVMAALSCSIAVAASAAPAASGAAPAGAGLVEAEATDALQQMGKYLQTLQYVDVKVRSSKELVLESGMKVQLDSAERVRAKKPDGLRVEMKSDRKTRDYYYDGKTLTIYSPKNGYYAKAPAPPTIRELLKKLSDDYGIDLPLSDLFTWGSDPAQVSRLTGALMIGLATIRGDACDQYVFRQEGVDWQIWIQRGAKPLPRRLVITTTTDPAMPQYTADIDWSFGEAPPASTFVFTPPKGTHQIPLKGANDTAAATAAPAK